MRHLIGKYQQNMHYLNILMTSFSTLSKYSHHEYFALYQKNHSINILQSLISNSILLAPCIVRTFEKTLTVVDINTIKDYSVVVVVVVVVVVGVVVGVCVP